MRGQAILFMVHRQNKHLFTEAHKCTVITKMWKTKAILCILLIILLLLYLLRMNQMSHYLIWKSTCRTASQILLWFFTTTPRTKEAMCKEAHPDRQ